MWKGISIIKATGSKTFDGICSKAFAFVSKQNLLLFYLLVLVFTRDVSSLKILSYTIDQKMKIDQKHWIFCSFWSKSLNLLPHIDKKSLNILLLLIKIIIFIIPPTNVLRAPQWSWPSPIDDIMRGSSPMYRSTVGNAEIQKRNIWKKSLIF